MRRLLRPSLLVGLTGLVLILVRVARAAEPDKDIPVEMSADHLDIDLEAKTALLVGHVKLTRGELVLGCPRVEVRYDQVPHVTWAHGSGGVVADFKGVHAEAPEVEVDVAGRALELHGGVRIAQGSGWITAEKASIHLATGKVTMTDVKGALPVPKSPP